jgi:hypothetical protein
MKNEKGFGAVEALAILIIVGIIGGAGYYVYNANKQDTGVSDSSIQEETTQEDTQDEFGEEGYVEVKEWNVRFKTSEGLDNTRYEYSDPESFAPAGSITFITKYDQELNELESNYEQSWAIYRYKAGDVVNDPGEEGLKIEDTFRAKNGDLKLIDGYYYELHYPMNNSGNPQIDSVLKKQNAATIEMYESLEPIR